MLRIAIAAFVMILPSLAWADKPAASASAAKLPHDAKLIYEATAPAVGVSTNIRRIARRNGALLARAGKVDYGNLSNSILQARSCLRLIRRKS